MNPQTNLLPRKPRRMKQPRKETLRTELARAASTIVDLKEAMAHMTVELDQARLHSLELWARIRNATPWWRRIFRKRT